LAFFAFPTARLAINTGEHNGRALRKRLARRTSNEELFEDALAEADDEIIDTDPPRPEFDEAGLYIPPVGEPPERFKTKPEKEKPRTRFYDRALREAIAKTENGFPGRGVDILLKSARDETPLPAFDEIVSALRALHPSGAVPEPMPHTAPALYIGPDIIRSECKRLARAKAPGCSGWTEDLLEQAVANDVVAEAIAAMVKDIVNNNLPTDIRDIIVTNRLVGIPKVPTGIRPIAIAEAIVKIASSIALMTCGKHLDETFGDLQFGLRVGGTENVIHTVRDQLLRNEDFCIIATDFGNAFNSVHREAIAEQLASDPVTSGLWNFWQFAYGTPAPLRIFSKEASTDILSSRGTRQGDPSAPALFCLALHPVLTRVRSSLRNAKLFAYMDDVVIVGDPVEAAAAFAQLMTLSKSIGLKGRFDKCKVYGTRSAEVAQQCGIVEEQQCISVLGACISRDRDQEAVYLQKKNAEYDGFFKKIFNSNVPNETQWSMLAACGPSRWNYSARTHDFTNVMAEHIAFDAKIANAFQQLAGIKGELSQVSRALMHLPRRSGGLGLQLFEVVGPHAYIASSSINPDQADQETLTHEANLEIIASLPDDARRHAESTKKANAWLDPRTKTNRPEAFGLALQHRIRHFGEIELRLRCDGCGTDLRHEEFDGHVLGCASRKSHNAATRHNRTRQAIATTLRQLGVDLQEEVAITRDKRMDIVIFNPDGSELWIDLTVFSTDSKTHRTKRRDVLEAAAERKKLATYADESGKQNCEFHALCFDVHGALSPKGTWLISRLAAMAGVASIDILRPATFALQIGNGMILENARGKKRQAAHGSRKVRRSNPALNHTPPPSDDEDFEIPEFDEVTPDREQQFTEDEVRNVTSLLCATPTAYDATRPTEAAHPTEEEEVERVVDTNAVYELDVDSESEGAPTHKQTTTTTTNMREEVDPHTQKQQQQKQQQPTTTTTTNMREERNESGKTQQKTTTTNMSAQQVDGSKNKTPTTTQNTESNSSARETKKQNETKTHKSGHSGNQKHKQHNNKNKWRAEENARNPGSATRG